MDDLSPPHRLQPLPIENFCANSPPLHHSPNPSEHTPISDNNDVIDGNNELYDIGDDSFVDGYGWVNNYSEDTFPKLSNFDSFDDFSRPSELHFGPYLPTPLAPPPQLPYFDGYNESQSQGINLYYDPTATTTTTTTINPPTTTTHTHSNHNPQHSSNPNNAISSEIKRDGDDEIKIIITSHIDCTPLYKITELLNLIADRPSQLQYQRDRAKIASSQLAGNYDQHQSHLNTSTATKTTLNNKNDLYNVQNRLKQFESQPYFDYLGPKRNRARSQKYELIYHFLHRTFAKIKHSTQSKTTNFEHIPRLNTFFALLFPEEHALRFGIKEVRLASFLNHAFFPHEYQQNIQEVRARRAKNIRQVREANVRLDRGAMTFTKQKGFLDTFRPKFGHMQEQIFRLITPRMVSSDAFILDSNGGKAISDGTGRGTQNKAKNEHFLNDVSKFSSRLKPINPCLYHIAYYLRHLQISSKSPNEKRVIFDQMIFGGQIDTPIPCFELNPNYNTQKEDYQKRYDQKLEQVKQTYKIPQKNQAKVIGLKFNLEDVSLTTEQLASLGTRPLEYFLYTDVRPQYVRGLTVTELAYISATLLGSSHTGLWITQTGFLEFAFAKSLDLTSILSLQWRQHREFEILYYFWLIFVGTQEEKDGVRGWVSSQVITLGRHFEPQLASAVHTSHITQNQFNLLPRESFLIQDKFDGMRLLVHLLPNDGTELEWAIPKDSYGLNRANQFRHQARLKRVPKGLPKFKLYSRQLVEHTMNYASTFKRYILPSFAGINNAVLDCEYVGFNLDTGKYCQVYANRTLGIREDKYDKGDDENWKVPSFNDYFSRKKEIENDLKMELEKQQQIKGDMDDMDDIDDGSCDNIVSNDLLEPAEKKGIHKHRLRVYHAFDDDGLKPPKSPNLHAHLDYQTNGVGKKSKILSNQGNNIAKKEHPITSKDSRFGKFKDFNTSNEDNKANFAPNEPNNNITISGLDYNVKQQGMDENDVGGDFEDDISDEELEGYYYEMGEEINDEFNLYTNDDDDDDHHKRNPLNIFSNIRISERSGEFSDDDGDDGQIFANPAIPDDAHDNFIVGKAQEIQKIDVQKDPRLSTLFSELEKSDISAIRPTKRLKPQQFEHSDETTTQNPKNISDADNIEKIKTSHSTENIVLVLRVFDIVYFDGKDLTRLPYWERRKILLTLFASRENYPFFTCVTDTLIVNKSNPGNGSTSNAIGKGTLGQSLGIYTNTIPEVQHMSNLLRLAHSFDGRVMFDDNGFARDGSLNEGVTQLITPVSNPIEVENAVELYKNHDINSPPYNDTLIRVPTSWKQYHPWCSRYPGHTGHDCSFCYGVCIHCQTAVMNSDQLDLRGASNGRELQDLQGGKLLTMKSSYRVQPNYNNPRQNSDNNLHHLPFVGLPHDVNFIQSRLNCALVRGLEGVVVKKLFAPYTFSSRKDWTKIKPHETLDLVVIGAGPATRQKPIQIGQVTVPVLGKFLLGVIDVQSSAQAQYSKYLFQCRQKARSSQLDLKSHEHIQTIEPFWDLYSRLKQKPSLIDKDCLRLRFVASVSAGFDDQLLRELTQTFYDRNLLIPIDNTSTPTEIQNNFGSSSAPKPKAKASLYKVNTPPWLVGGYKAHYTHWIKDPISNPIIIEIRLTSYNLENSTGNCIWLPQDWFKARFMYNKDGDFSQDPCWTHPLSPRISYIETPMSLPGHIHSSQIKSLRNDNNYRHLTPEQRQYHAILQTEELKNNDCPDNEWNAESCKYRYLGRGLTHPNAAIQLCQVGLREPRLSKIRNDKQLHEIDQSETLLNHYMNQRQRINGREVNSDGAIVRANNFSGEGPIIQQEQRAVLPRSQDNVNSVGQLITNDKKYGTHYVDPTQPKYDQRWAEPFNLNNFITLAWSRVNTRRQGLPIRIFSDEDPQKLQYGQDWLGFVFRLGLKTILVLNILKRKYQLWLDKFQKNLNIQVKAKPYEDSNPDDKLKPTTRNDHPNNSKTSHPLITQKAPKKALMSTADVLRMKANNELTGIDQINQDAHFANALKTAFQPKKLTRQNSNNMEDYKDEFDVKHSDGSGNDDFDDDGNGNGGVGNVGNNHAIHHDSNFSLYLGTFADQEPDDLLPPLERPGSNGSNLISAASLSQKIPLSARLKQIQSLRTMSILSNQAGDMTSLIPPAIDNDSIQQTHIENMYEPIPSTIQSEAKGTDNDDNINFDDVGSMNDHNAGIDESDGDEEDEDDWKRKPSKLQVSQEEYDILQSKDNPFRSLPRIVSQIKSNPSVTSPQALVPVTQSSVQIGSLRARFRALKQTPNLAESPFVDPPKTSFVQRTSIEVDDMMVDNQNGFNLNKSDQPTQTNQINVEMSHTEVQWGEATQIGEIDNQYEYNSYGNQDDDIFGGDSFEFDDINNGKNHVIPSDESLKSSNTIKSTRSVRFEPVVAHDLTDITTQKEESVLSEAFSKFQPSLKTTGLNPNPILGSKLNSNHSDVFDGPFGHQSEDDSDEDDDQNDNRNNELTEDQIASIIPYIISDAITDEGITKLSTLMSNINSKQPSFGSVLGDVAIQDDDDDDIDTVISQVTALVDFHSQSFFDGELFSAGLQHDQTMSDDNNEKISDLSFGRQSGPKMDDDSDDQVGKWTQRPDFPYEPEIEDSIDEDIAKLDQHGKIITKMFKNFQTSDLPDKLDEVVENLLPIQPPVIQKPNQTNNKSTKSPLIGWDGDGSASDHETFLNFGKNKRQRPNPSIVTNSDPSTNNTSENQSNIFKNSDQVHIGEVFQRVSELSKKAPTVQPHDLNNNPNAKKRPLLLDSDSDYNGDSRKDAKTTAKESAKIPVQFGVKSRERRRKNAGNTGIDEIADMLNEQVANTGLQTKVAKSTARVKLAKPKPPSSFSQINQLSHAISAMKYDLNTVTGFESYDVMNVFNDVFSNYGYVFSPEIFYLNSLEKTTTIHEKLRQIYIKRNNRSPALADLSNTCRVNKSKLLSDKTREKLAKHKRLVTQHGQRLIRNGLDIIIETNLSSRTPKSNEQIQAAVKKMSQNVQKIVKAELNQTPRTARRNKKPAKQVDRDENSDFSQTDSESEPDRVSLKLTPTTTKNAPEMKLTPKKSPNTSRLTPTTTKGLPPTKLHSRTGLSNQSDDFSDPFESNTASFTTPKKKPKKLQNSSLPTPIRATLSRTSKVKSNQLIQFPTLSTIRQQLNNQISDDPEVNWVGLILPEPYEENPTLNLQLSRVLNTQKHRPVPVSTVLPTGMNPVSKTNRNFNSVPISTQPQSSYPLPVHGLPTSLFSHAHALVDNFIDAHNIARTDGSQYVSTNTFLNYDISPTLHNSHKTSHIFTSLSFFVAQTDHTVFLPYGVSLVHNPRTNNGSDIPDSELLNYTNVTVSVDRSKCPESTDPVTLGLLQYLVNYKSGQIPGFTKNTRTKDKSMRTVEAVRRDEMETRTNVRKQDKFLVSDAGVVDAFRSNLEKTTQYARQQGFPNMTFDVNQLSTSISAGAGVSSIWEEIDPEKLALGKSAAIDAHPFDHHSGLSNTAIDKMKNIAFGRVKMNFKVSDFDYNNNKAFKQLIDGAVQTELKKMILSTCEQFNKHHSKQDFAPGSVSQSPSHHPSPSSTKSMTHLHSELQQNQGQIKSIDVSTVVHNNNMSRDLDIVDLFLPKYSHKNHAQLNLSKNRNQNAPNNPNTLNHASINLSSPHGDFTVSSLFYQGGAGFDDTNTQQYSLLENQTNVFSLQNEIIVPMSSPYSMSPSTASPGTHGQLGGQNGINLGGGNAIGNSPPQLQPQISPEELTELRGIVDNHTSQFIQNSVMPLLKLWAIVPVLHNLDSVQIAATPSLSSTENAHTRSLRRIQSQLSTLLSSPSNSANMPQLAQTLSHLSHFDGNFQPNTAQNSQEYPQSNEFIQLVSQFNEYLNYYKQACITIAETRFCQEESKIQNQIQSKFRIELQNTSLKGSRSGDSSSSPSSSLFSSPWGSSFEPRSSGHHTADLQKLSLVQPSLSDYSSSAINVLNGGATKSQRFDMFSFDDYHVDQNGPIQQPMANTTSLQPNHDGKNQDRQAQQGQQGQSRMGKPTAYKNHHRLRAKHLSADHLRSILSSLGGHIVLSLPSYRISQGGKSKFLNEIVEYFLHFRNFPLHTINTTGSSLPLSYIRDNIDVSLTMSSIPMHIPSMNPLQFREQFQYRSGPNYVNDSDNNIFYRSTEPLPEYKLSHSKNLINGYQPLYFNQNVPLQYQKLPEPGEIKDIDKVAIDNSKNNDHKIQNNVVLILASQISSEVAALIKSHPSYFTRRQRSYINTYPAEIIYTDFIVIKPQWVIESIARGSTMTDCLTKMNFFSSLYFNNLSQYPLEHISSQNRIGVLPSYASVQDGLHMGWGPRVFNQTKSSLFLKNNSFIIHPAYLLYSTFPVHTNTSSTSQGFNTLSGLQNFSTLFNGDSLRRNNNLAFEHVTNSQQNETKKPDPTPIKTNLSKKLSRTFTNDSLNSALMRLETDSYDSKDIVQNRLSEFLSNQSTNSLFSSLLSASNLTTKHLSKSLVLTAPNPYINPLSLRFTPIINTKFLHLLQKCGLGAGVLGANFSQKNFSEINLHSMLMLMTQYTTEYDIYGVCNLPDMQYKQMSQSMPDLDTIPSQKDKQGERNQFNQSLYNFEKLTFFSLQEEKKLEDFEYVELIKVWKQYAHYVRQSYRKSIKNGPIDDFTNNFTTSFKQTNPFKQANLENQTQPPHKALSEASSSTSSTTTINSKSKELNLGGFGLKRKTVNSKYLIGAGYQSPSDDDDDDDDDDHEEAYFRSVTRRTSGKRHNNKASKLMVDFDDEGYAENNGDEYLDDNFNLEIDILLFNFVRKNESNGELSLEIIQDFLHKKYLQYQSQKQINYEKDDGLNDPLGDGNRSIWNYGEKYLPNLNILPFSEYLERKLSQKSQLLKMSKQYPPFPQISTSQSILHENKYHEFLKIREEQLNPKQKMMDKSHGNKLPPGMMGMGMGMGLASGNLIVDNNKQNSQPTPPTPILSIPFSPERTILIDSNDLMIKKHQYNYHSIIFDQINIREFFMVLCAQALDSLDLDNLAPASSDTSKSKFPEPTALRQDPSPSSLKKSFLLTLQERIQDDVKQSAQRSNLVSLFAPLKKTAPETFFEYFASFFVKFFQHKKTIYTQSNAYTMMNQGKSLTTPSSTNLTKSTDLELAAKMFASAQTMKSSNLRKIMNKYYTPHIRSLFMLDPVYFSGLNFGLEKIRGGEFDIFDQVSDNSDEIREQDSITRSSSHNNANDKDNESSTSETEYDDVNIVGTNNKSKIRSTPHKKNQFQTNQTSSIDTKLSLYILEKQIVEMNYSQYNPVLLTAPLVSSFLASFVSYFNSLSILNWFQSQYLYANQHDSTFSRAYTMKNMDEALRSRTSAEFRGKLLTGFSQSTSFSKLSTFSTFYQNQNNPKITLPADKFPLFFFYTQLKQTLSYWFFLRFFLTSQLSSMSLYYHTQQIRHGAICPWGKHHSIGPNMNSPLSTNLQVNSSKKRNNESKRGLNDADLLSFPIYFGQIVTIFREQITKLQNYRDYLIFQQKNNDSISNLPINGTARDHIAPLTTGGDEKSLLPNPLSCFIVNRGLIDASESTQLSFQVDVSGSTDDNNDQNQCRPSNEKLFKDGPFQPLPGPIMARFKAYKQGVNKFTPHSVDNTHETLIDETDTIQTTVYHASIPNTDQFHQTRCFKYDSLYGNSKAKSGKNSCHNNLRNKPQCRSNNHVSIGSCVQTQLYHDLPVSIVIRHTKWSIIQQTITALDSILTILDKCLHNMIFLGESIHYNLQSHYYNHEGCGGFNYLSCPCVQFSNVNYLSFLILLLVDITSTSLFIPTNPIKTSINNTNILEITHLYPIQTHFSTKNHSQNNNNYFHNVTSAPNHDQIITSTQSQAGASQGTFLNVQFILSKLQRFFIHILYHDTPFEWNDTQTPPIPSNDAVPSQKAPKEGPDKRNSSLDRAGKTIGGKLHSGEAIARKSAKASVNPRGNLSRQDTEISTLSINLDESFPNLNSNLTSARTHIIREEPLVAIDSNIGIGRGRPGHSNPSRGVSNLPDPIEPSVIVDNNVYIGDSIRTPLNPLDFMVFLYRPLIPQAQSQGSKFHNSYNDHLKKAKEKSLQYNQTPDQSITDELIYSYYRDSLTHEANKVLNREQFFPFLAKNPNLRRHLVLQHLSFSHGFIDIRQISIKIHNLFYFRPSSYLDSFLPKREINVMCLFNQEWVNDGKIKPQNRSKNQNGQNNPTRKANNSSNHYFSIPASELTFSNIHSLDNSSTPDYQKHISDIMNYSGNEYVPFSYKSSLFSTLLFYFSYVQTVFISPFEQQSTYAVLSSNLTNAGTGSNLPVLPLSAFPSSSNPLQPSLLPSQKLSNSNSSLTSPQSVSPFDSISQLSPFELAAGNKGKSTLTVGPRINLSNEGFHALKLQMKYLPTRVNRLPFDETYGISSHIIPISSEHTLPVLLSSVNNPFFIEILQSQSKSNNSPGADDLPSVGGPFDTVSLGGDKAGHKVTSSTKSQNLNPEILGALASNHPDLIYSPEKSQHTWCFNKTEEFSVTFPSEFSRGIKTEEILSILTELCKFIQIVTNNQRDQYKALIKSLTILPDAKTDSNAHKKNPQTKPTRSNLGKSKGPNQPINLIDEPITPIIPDWSIQNEVNKIAQKPTPLSLFSELTPLLFDPFLFITPNPDKDSPQIVSTSLVDRSGSNCQAESVIETQKSFPRTTFFPQGHNSSPHTIPAHLQTYLTSYRVKSTPNHPILALNSNSSRSLLNFKSQPQPYSLNNPHYASQSINASLELGFYPGAKYSTQNYHASPISLFLQHAYSANYSKIQRQYHHHLSDLVNNLYSRSLNNSLQNSQFIQNFPTPLLKNQSNNGLKSLDALNSLQSFLEPYDSHNGPQQIVVSIPISSKSLLSNSVLFGQNIDFSWFELMVNETITLLHTHITVIKSQFDMSSSELLKKYNEVRMEIEASKKEQMRKNIAKFDSKSKKEKDKKDEQLITLDGFFGKANSVVDPLDQTLSTLSNVQTLSLGDYDRFATGVHHINDLYGDFDGNEYGDDTLMNKVTKKSHSKNVSFKNQKIQSSSFQVLPFQYMYFHRYSKLLNKSHYKIDIIYNKYGSLINLGTSFEWAKKLSFFQKFKNNSSSSSVSSSLNPTTSISSNSQRITHIQSTSQSLKLCQTASTAATIVSMTDNEDLSRSPSTGLRSNTRTTNSSSTNLSQSGTDIQSDLYMPSLTEIEMLEFLFENDAFLLNLYNSQSFYQIPLVTHPSSPVILDFVEFYRGSTQKQRRHLRVPQCIYDMVDLSLSKQARQLSITDYFSPTPTVSDPKKATLPLNTNQSFGIGIVQRSGKAGGNLDGLNETQREIFDCQYGKLSQYAQLQLNSPHDLLFPHLDDGGLNSGGNKQNNHINRLTSFQDSYSCTCVLCQIFFNLSHYNQTFILLSNNNHNDFTQKFSSQDKSSQKTSQNSPHSNSKLLQEYICIIRMKLYLIIRSALSKHQKLLQLSLVYQSKVSFLWFYYLHLKPVLNTTSIPSTPSKLPDVGSTPRSTVSHSVNSHSSGDSNVTFSSLHYPSNSLSTLLHEHLQNNLRNGVHGVKSDNVIRTLGVMNDHISNPRLFSTHPLTQPHHPLFPSLLSNQYEFNPALLWNSISKNIRIKLETIWQKRSEQHVQIVLGKIHKLMSNSHHTLPSSPHNFSDQVDPFNVFDLGCGEFKTNLKSSSCTQDMVPKLKTRLESLFKINFDDSLWEQQDRAFFFDVLEQQDDELF